MKFGAILLGVWFGVATHANAAGQQPTQDPRWVLRNGAGSPDLGQLSIATPTYSTDGVIRGASASGFSQPASGPLVLYVYSKGTLCESVSASSELPTDAAFGWRVDITPVKGVPFTIKFSKPPNRADGPVVITPADVRVKVDWRRLWDRGQKLAGDAGGSAVLTLHAGDHVMLDFLGAGAAPTAACNAVGMGLEIGFGKAKATGLIETDMWLVHRLPDGSEQTQHQVLRSRVGGGVEYFFDDVKIQGAAGDAPVEVFGKILPYAIEDGSVRLRFEVTRKHLTSGSSGSDLAAKPGEVLSFNLPLDPSDGALAGHRLSVRLRATVKSPE